MSEQTNNWALVVDDDVLILMDAVSILEDAGFAVLDAPNVKEALALLERHHPHLTLLFTDVHMPGEHDGFHLARVAARQWPHISIVVASGQATPGPGDLPDGATFINKPFSADIVRHQLRQNMPRHNQPRKLSMGAHHRHDLGITPVTHGRCHRSSRERRNACVIAGATGHNGGPGRRRRPRSR